MDSQPIRHEAARRKPVAEAPTRRGLPRILVVEDDPHMVAIVERVVRSLSPAIRVDHAPDVAGAREQIHIHDYALVLSDYQLDGSASGLALRAWCRDRGVEAPFVMMSAFAIRDELEATPGSRCPFLPKPFSLAKLRTFIERTVSPEAL